MPSVVQQRSTILYRRAWPALVATVACASVIASAAPARATNVAKAWGANGSGQLGDGATEGSAVPVSVSGLNGVTAISGGWFHSLALLEGGTVMAWGEGTSGQLGDGTTESSDVPVTVRGLTGAVAVSAGARHSLALLRGGTVSAWGNGRLGQLGDGSTESSDVPVTVRGLTGVVAVSAGANHSLALLEDGTVMAWGANGSGQLGDGSAESSDVPVTVRGLTGVVAISAGMNHSLAVLRNGAVMAWGANDKGQLGDGTESDSDVPVAVKSLTGAVAVGVSAGQVFSLARMSDGTVMAWGANEDGQLGDGTSAGPEMCGLLPPLPCSRAPVAVARLTGVVKVAAGKFHSLALLSNGRVMAWGQNNSGQLGDGIAEGPERCAAASQPCSTFPVEATNLAGVLGTAAGGEHSLAFGPPPPPPTQLPELGRCVRVRAGGAYERGNCLTLSPGHSGAFEWLPGPGARPRFSIPIPEAQLETVGGARVSCGASSLEGTWTGPKTASASLSLRSCVNSATAESCQTALSGVGEIRTEGALQGELGFVKGGSEPRVGLDLRPTSPSVDMLAFTCGGLASEVGAETWTVGGSVIGQLKPLDGMRVTFKALYKGTKGKQVPEFFEALPKDTPLAARFVGTESKVEDAGLTLRGERAAIEGANEEALEIKAK
ncbi:MAG: cell wall anchor protein [Actinobacteria bacterium]|nr:MAG: cell wall anchor protein [Actinomycetota bacterium]